MSFLIPKVARFIGCRLIPNVFCEEESSDGPSLIEQADALIENKKSKLRPVSLENVKNTFQQNSVSTFDGFRLVVQKQANLNTVVSHFYWLGSQATGQPIYQYRVILPFDDKMINVATDMDFNVEGEIKYPLTSNISTKTNFAIGEQATNMTIDVDYSDADSSTQLQYTNANATALNLSRMQALTPHLSIGGIGRYSLDKGTLETGYAALYDDEKNQIAAEYDTNLRLMYMKRVNPNRVHVATELVVDDSDSKVAVTAEYILKQSKIHLGIDSNLLLKSQLETAMSPGVSLQLSAEINQLKDQYRFGYGIVMG